MQEEIFGPILPLIPYRSFSQALAEIRKRPKPLALYLFTHDPDHERRALREVSFGGGCVNDVVVHLTNPHMPFGGVGESGMGAYHGKAGFLTFSHQKSILKKSTAVDLPVRYPPYAGKAADRTASHAIKEAFQMNDIEQLQAWIDESCRIVFFGGAGVSTESGIPDFRSRRPLQPKIQIIRLKPC